jgi:two-component system, response regulator YesN
MYTVLIADDEKLARFALRNVLEEKLTEIKVIGEANSSDDIIELCEKLEPDIVFMDIHMPGINGLDAASLILRKNPDINIFVLTAYDYFDYIQQAIEIGVKGYILKPIVVQQIVDLIEKVKNSINEKRAIDENTQTVFEKVNDLRPAVEEELIWMMISGRYNKQNIRRYLSFLNIQAFKAAFVVAKYIPEDIASQYNSVKKAEADIQDILSRYLSKQAKCILGRMLGKNIPVFVMAPSGDEQQFLSDLRSITEDIVKKVNAKYGIRIRIGIGNVYESVESMHLSYSEALMALKGNINSSVSSYVEIKSKAKGKAAAFEYPFDMEKKLVQMIKLNKTHECRALAIDIVDSILISNSKIDKVIEYLESFIVTLKKQLLYIRVPLESILEVANLRELQNISEINQIKRWARTTVDSIIGLLDQNKEERKVNVFNNILQFVNEQYCADISLELVAENVGLTPQYVSKLFKEELGMNFIEYVTEKRIASAKHLLKTTKLKIKDVAVESGYSDSNYFCKIFKKYVGQTPKEYHTRYFNS